MDAIPSERCTHRMNRLPLHTFQRRKGPLSSESTRRKELLAARCAMVAAARRPSRGEGLEGRWRCISGLREPLVIFYQFYHTIQSLIFILVLRLFASPSHQETEAKHNMYL